MFPIALLYVCVGLGIVATVMVICLDKTSILMLKGLITPDKDPGSLGKLQKSYIVVYLCAIMADWLQGPFVYALYSSYGISRSDNAMLFVAGFGSSALFGTFVGSMADQYGRRNFAGLYCLLYMVSCLTKHFNSFGVLMVGRITGGIATSLLYSVFDSWLVSELNEHGFGPEQLGGSFSLALFGNSLVAIAAGEVGQLMADLRPLTNMFGSVYYGGYLAPFDTAILFCVFCCLLLFALWPENYGKQQSEAVIGDGESRGITKALIMFAERPMIFFCGLVCSLFEASMFIFVFNWTPCLMEKGQPDPPFGHIFAAFMIMCMLGSRLFSFAAQFVSIEAIGLCTLVLSAACHCAVAVSPSVVLSFFAFLAFEMCVGMYFPMMGTLKGQIVPEAKRSTIYNLYRVPLNAIVVATLLLQLDTSTSFVCTSAMLTIAALSLWRIMSMGGAKQAAGNESNRYAEDERDSLHLDDGIQLEAETIGKPEG
mmetsp:Transcript_104244/g.290380  ORF Transcript_104244/g.290380 Transcript_104244/m.290380 type:complete len:482 (-) Transcript_104244:53-1498(-)